MAMKLKAVIDRFEKDNALLIVVENKKEYVVPRDSLPPNVVEGLWLLIEVEDQRVMDTVIDEEETTKVRERLTRFRPGGISPIT